jgi:tRNA (cytidine56-2'-O)-methyltransferase
VVRIAILRMGHRLFRDSRVTTHVCLTARALGADQAIIANNRDKELESTIREVSDRFGGGFNVETGANWKQVIQTWRESRGQVVHLTVYGLPLSDVVEQIRDSNKDLLVVVGSEKMPGEMFRLADWNVSVTSQPMSEVGALAIFLDWYHSHRGLGLSFPGSKVRIIPSKNRKLLEQTV